MLTDATLGRLFTLFTNDSDSFFGIFDRATLRPLQINPAGLALLDLDSLADYSGRYPNGFMKDGFRPDEFSDRFEPLWRDGSWRGRVEWRRHSTGEVFWVWTRMMVDEADEQGYLLILATLLDQEYALSHRKSEFISAISHEFRTPLAIMQTAVALLPRLDHPQKQQQQSLAIQAQIQHLTELLDTLLQQALHGEKLSAHEVHETANGLKNTN
ncbi:histidine kinase dimerization/phospho-acceptor domain-containing protein [Larkinella terrae]|uniref:histidine kinase n=1 Tax=Larkinella terrae TaxID=2025311 RepID=A0A7K0EED0_9BACT|nr:histidine kinase dimerization/phospho-acceptor domain-containing protein [Larkinella terrae]MRS60177.1 hypothetical protein [Larkinella terrae]